MFRFPPQYADVIADLQVGDEVEIEIGAGHPATEQKIVEVIISVSGFSALTNSGRMLSCTDGRLVSITGAHYDNEDQYPEPVTDAARQILAEISQLQAGFRGILHDLDPDWAKAFRDDLL